jgi:dihydroorotate dehydrogenase electron transfer subunit
LQLQTSRFFYTLSQAGAIIMTQSIQQKGPFEARVSFNKKVGQRFYRLGLQFDGAGAEAFGGTRPGQFAQFDVSNIALPTPEAIPEELKDVSARQILLRRPFSFARVVKEAAPSTALPASLGELRRAGGAGKTTVEVVYCVLGPATLRMTTLTKGASISVIGPLGNGFQIPQDKKRALLVAGGTGTPPLEHLAQVLTAESPAIDVIAFAGAKTVGDLPFEKRLDKLAQEVGFALAEFGQYGIGSFVATDDGSVGFKGTVTSCLLNWLSQNSPNPAETIIYACGPQPMLASIAQIAKDGKIGCQVSMEEMMACGIGLCQSCAIKCRGANPGETIYKLCCKDGPVFDAKEVVF